MSSLINAVEVRHSSRHPHLKLQPILCVVNFDILFNVSMQPLTFQ